MTDFVASMTNKWARSDCAAPDVAVQAQPDESLRVERTGDILKIAAINEQTGSVEARIYGRLFFDRVETSIFSLLPKLPPGVQDPRFFSANGTAVTFQDGGKRRLKAVGTDTNTGGVCGGWIFDATEK